jgi:predicted kinase
MLVVVSGPPGTGTTTLAHALAAEITCPAICRDEIKEGMAHAAGAEFVPGSGDPLTQRTFDVFFDLLRVLVTAGASVVAESAWQDGLWRGGLEQLAADAKLRIVQCHVDPETAMRRARERKATNPIARRAHADLIGWQLDDWKRVFAEFERLSLPAPSLDVDTTDGYVPEVPALVEFVNSGDR